MWFKNLTIYRFNKPFSVTTEALESALETCQFTPCNSQEISKFGFTTALGKHGQTLTHSANNCHLICATKEEKILPTQVVKEALEDKVLQIENSENRKLSKKEKTALKDEVITTLLPRAFSKRHQISALIIADKSLLIVDSSSSAKAEELMALLRKALGSLPIIPLTFETPIEFQLTHWLKKGIAPTPFEIQHEAELKAITDEGGIVKFKQQDLKEDEVLAHLETGKQVHQLALHFGQSTSFLLHADSSLKRIKFAEEFRASNDEIDDDPMAKLDADFVLMSNELIALVENLINVFSNPLTK